MKDILNSETERLIVRKNLEFSIETAPKYWFGQDPFKTRFFDGLGLAFPDGERYFIQSVRKFRDKVEDQKLQDDIADFFKQEAMHGIAHNLLNKKLEKQGLPVSKMLKKVKAVLNYNLNNKTPEYNLAVTVAFEHITALLATTFFDKRSTLESMDPHIRALWAWHAIEEMEHKCVAYDVMKQVGNVDELTRKKAFIATLIIIGISAFGRANAMLRYDGFNRWERFKLMAKGINWIFGYKGVMTPTLPLLFDGLRKNFDPRHHPIMPQYEVWLKAFKETGDPIYAGDAFWKAGK